MTEPVDRWAAAEAYDVFMGRWSRAVAERFVRWLDATPGLTWLDVGCGTGALASTIGRLAEPARVVACDPSGAFVDHARRRAADSRIAFVRAGVEALPHVPGGFDRVVSGLVLNFLPDPLRAIEAMRDRARPGGVVAAYVWDYADGMQFLRVFWDEACALDAAARPLDEGVRFPLCRRGACEATLREAGLHDARFDAIEIPTRFESFEDYWQPFLGGTGPAPGYVVSLAAEARERLRERLRDRLTGGRPGAIELSARAWAARGRVAEPSPRG